MILCDRCYDGAPPMAEIGDVCEGCGAVYVKNLSYNFRRSEKFAGQWEKFYLPGWRHKTALEMMKEALDET